MNYGMLFTAWGTAGILGPIIGGRVFDRFQDYRFAFYTAGVLAILAAVSLFFASRFEASEREKKL
jgi:OFA family oxalate/formate antiporter-like MFS transporter